MIEGITCSKKMRHIVEKRIQKRASALTKQKQAHHKATRRRKHHYSDEEEAILTPVCIQLLCALAMLARVLRCHVLCLTGL